MTKRLYYDHSALKSFDGRIVGRVDVGGRPAVVLDRTAFYPEGGGQPSDRGRLNHAQVVDVISRDDESGDVLHVLSEPLADDAVHGAIDWPRRFDLMQQHTGQHVLSQAFIRVLEAETVAFHLNDDPRDGTVTIDLNQTALKPADVDAVEDLANRIVYENRPVTTRFVDAADLAAIPLRKPPAIDASIRVVEIADFDWSACGGTHVARTGEIGQIKIVKLERRGAETRVEFRCGRRALADYRRKNQLISAVAADLSIGFWELDRAAARLLADNKSLRRQLERAQERMLEFEARELLSGLRSRGDHAVAMRVWHDRDLGTLRKLAAQIITRPGTIALLGSGGEKPALVFARSSDVALDMNALLRGAAKRIGGKGGGSPDFAQAGSPPASDEQVQAAIEWAYENVMREA
jgi:alanyl-tRNA synthetase